MTDVRMLVSWGPPSSPVRDWFSNTLYFAVDEVGEPNYEELATDLLAIYQGLPFSAGVKTEVRAYNMADDSPRPERAYKTATKTGTQANGPHQVALCLSYYADRNLPRQRGRIYMGPYATPPVTPDLTTQQRLITFGQALAGLGGVNVDWSVYSPTRAAEGGDGTMSISDIWVDDSWDVIRSRKLPAQTRVTAHVGE